MCKFKFHFTLYNDYTSSKVLVCIVQAIFTSAIRDAPSRAKNLMIAKHGSNYMQCYQLTACNERGTCQLEELKERSTLVDAGHACF
jgi:hypothetical protein